MLRDMEQVLSERQRLSRIRIWLGLFVAGLLIAGITAARGCRRPELHRRENR
jgi:hypothetical protein